MDFSGVLFVCVCGTLSHLEHVYSMYVYALYSMAIDATTSFTVSVHGNSTIQVCMYIRNIDYVHTVNIIW